MKKMYIFLTAALVLGLIAGSSYSYINKPGDDLIDKKTTFKIIKKTPEIISFVDGEERVVSNKIIIEGEEMPTMEEALESVGE